MVSIDPAGVTLPASADSLASALEVLGVHGIPGRWRGRDAFTVMQSGFGAGVEFLAAWLAWRDDPARCERLHFVAFEPAPATREALAEALRPVGAFDTLARALVIAWPPPLAGFHRVHFDAGRVILTIAFGPTAQQLPQLVGRVDAFLLGSLATAADGALWSPAAMRELARVAAPGATLSTPVVAGGVLAALGDSGFQVERRTVASIPMLVGVYARDGTEEAVPPRRAVVVGAGLAGTLVAERLAFRGWDVQLVDARAARSNAAVGLLRPIVNLRDALNAQASRSAFLYSLQHFRALQHDGYHLPWSRCGVLQLASDADEASRFAAIVSSHAYPPGFLAFVDSARAREIAGREVRGPGWHFPGGAYVSPEGLAVASLARAGARVGRIAGRAVDRIARGNEGWQALDAAGAVIAAAPILVLANAADAMRLLPEARLPLSAVRGQVTYVPPDPTRALEVVVSGSGYVSPLPDGGHCIGASYHHDDLDESVRAHDHRDNLARAESMLPGFTSKVHPMGLGGWTGFRATVPDRLPIYGATQREGVWVATGLGSRGLLWAPLGAELISCALSGEPLPWPRDLAAAISPRRFN